MNRRDYEREMRLIRLRGRTDMLAAAVLLVLALALVTPAASLMHAAPARLAAALTAALR
jgi:hypothetical protein